MKRQAVTLLETLVAIFVMGIGLIALFTLFPIGILRMAAAIQADRTAQAARIAEHHANIVWTGPQGPFNVRHDPLVIFDAAAPAAPPDTFVNPFPTFFKEADPDGPSFPVFVDPLGYRMGSLASQHWIAGANGTVPRRSTSFAGVDLYLTTRWFTLLDDMPFEVDGTVRVDNPAEPDPTKRIFAYDGQYTWAYLLQRPRTSDKSVVNLSVVVFKGRVLSPTPVLTLEESLYQDGNAGTAVAFGNNTITIAVGGGQTLPAVRTGDWMLDATYYETNAKSIPTTTVGAMNGNFYQIVGIKDIVPDAQVEYEVQPPLRNLNALTGASTVVRRVLILDGVVDVFDKGPGRMP